ncbi:MAG: BatD family protein [Chromatiaceae bacterium]|nr:BatD family protein [Chromatiaceae bacterium]
MPRIRTLLCPMLALVLFAAAGGAAAEVRARLSQESTAIDQPIQLVLEAETSGDARPDLSVLEADFQILDRRSQHSVSIRNGRRSERHALTLVLLPRRNGELEIPPIPFGGERSPPLRLTVTGEPSSIAPSAPLLPSPFGQGWDVPGADRGALPGPSMGALPFPQSAPDTTATGLTSDAEALVEAEIAPTEVRVREQALLTVRVLADRPLPAAALRDPKPQGARVLPLGEDRYPLSRADRSYQVYERRYAVFADEPGLVEIGPIEVASAGYQGLTQASSPVLKLRVRTIPPGIPRSDWLPARKLTLTEAGPEVIRVRPGQTVERVITLTAEGVPAADLPRVVSNAPFQLQQQPTAPELWDRRERGGIVGTRVDRIRLSPRELGVYRLPEIRLAWWGTEDGRAQTAMLPARAIEAIAFATGDERAASDGAGAPAAPGQTAEVPAGPEAAGPADRPASATNPWFWISLLLAAALLLALGARWRTGALPPARPEPPTAIQTPPSRPADPVESAIEEVRHAYGVSSANAARQALLAWAGLVMPDAPPSNLARLAQRCPEPLRTEILMLEETFFSPRPVPWAEQPVWTRLRGIEPLAPEEPASHRRGKPLRRKRVQSEAS